MDRRFVEFRSRGDGAAPDADSNARPAASPWRLFQRQQIPPAANLGPFITDWMPEFAGYSWIAYGAESQLVIRIIASPGSEELGVGRLFQQVLETRLVQVSDESSRVSVVRWGAPRSGHVAAAAGNCVYIFAPRSLSSSKNPALPLEWEPKSILVHASAVSHISWTESGDGVLSAAGLKVLMWKQDDAGGWVYVWQSQVNWPQAVSAATWSYSGLAATADCEDDVKGRATIWWWEEESDPHAVELSHPRQVLGIQWRPVSDELSHEQHRPILLTSCKDGVVRLWLEIDSGKARLEKNAGKDSSGKSLKPAFFVSVVIEVNTRLQASLGVDCFVTWALEGSHGDTGSSDEVAACEWMVGIGPQKTIALWSLHCLDDISPPRCPRVVLWQQGTLNSEPELRFATVPFFFSSVIQRTRPSVPPTSIDLVEVFHGGFVRRSRVWPPVASIGGRSSIKGSLESGSISKISTWGYSSEELFTCGHTGDQVNVALHPARLAAIAASVDKTGVLLLWSTNLPLEPYIEVPSLHVSAWRLCGRILAQTEDNFLPAVRWSPIILLGDRMVLFVSLSQVIHCYLIAKGRGKDKSWVSYDLLCELQPPASAGKISLEEICVITKLERDQPVTVLVACGSNGSLVMAWKLDLQICKTDIDEQSGCVIYRGLLAGDDESIVISSSMIDDIKLDSGERFLTSTSRTSPYDFVSSCEDGSIRLWKVTLQERSGHWECVGQVTRHLGRRLALAACGSNGIQIAASTGSDASVNIWEISSSSSGFLSDQIVLPRAPDAMSWFDGGTGVQLLGVLSGDHVQVYVEGRFDSSEYSSWGCLASVKVSSSIVNGGISWGPQGSLVLSSGSRIVVFSHWARKQESCQAETSGSQSLLKAANLATVPLPNCHPRSIFHLLSIGQQHQARICLRRLLSHVRNRVGDLSEFPNVQVQDLQKPASADNQNPKAWVFGESIDDSEETQRPDSDGPLSGSELQQLASIVNQNSQLLAVLDIMRELDGSAKYNYLDQPGRRFTLVVRFNKFQNPDASSSDMLADPKAMAWAFQSECKDALIDILVPANDLSWSALRALGAGFWFTDVEQLRSRIEKLARSQFLKQRDPKDCALFYVALDRKTVLSGLCKLSRDQRDRPLVDFFARNFQEDTNKAAALKNAYVLMGKHRHELAAAFFLLGGDLDSAVAVCTKSLGDPQLALVICRLSEGINGAAARHLISTELLPHAEAHDKWLATVLQCLLGQRLEGLYELVGKDDGLAKSFVLDPDVGDYCREIYSKPGMQTNPSVINRAFQISARALKKLGLPLQALESLRRYSPDSSYEQPTNKTWISTAVADDLFRLTNEELILKYVVPFVEQHPLWGYDTDSKQADLSEDSILQDLIILEKKFSFNTSSIVDSLSSMSWNCARPWFGYWLLSSASLLLTNKRPLSPSLIGEMLDSVTTTGPEILCATILACGAASCPQSFVNELGAYGGMELDQTNEAHIGLERNIATEICNTSTFNELRFLASQINQLTSGSNSSRHPRIAGAESRPSLLALIFCLGTAWLERRSELLLPIVRMMFDVETFDLNVCFRLKPPSNANREGKAESETGAALNDDDSWLVLGVALWSQVLTFAKRQLAGGSPEVAYSGFGRTSPRHSTISSFSRLSITKVSVESAKSSSGSGAGDGRPLLSSLACILARLRKQLALRIMDVAPDHPLYTVLWGNNNQELEETGEAENAELWKVLGVRDEARSALKLEGLDGSQKKEAGTRWVVVKSNKGSASTSSTSEESSETRSRQRSRSFTVKGLIQTHFNTRFGKGVDALQLPGDSLEAMSVNNCSPEQVVVASSSKGLVYLDLDTYASFSDSNDNLWAEVDWPQNSWAGSVSTPVPTYVSPGVGLGSKGGSGIGLGGAAVGMGTLSKEFRKGAVGFGIPGYAGMAAWSMGWEEMTDFDGYDAPATIANVKTSTTAAHPLRPYFLVGSQNTHVYLWKFGETSATATYGVLPAANVPPPYALASVSSVQFDRCGHRFATAAVDGTVCTWQLDVGGRSNVRPTESELGFDRHAWDVTFIGESGAIVAATGSSRSGENLVIWNTLAPPSSAKISVACHEGGARCLDLVQDSSPLIITGGKSGDLAVLDFRCITGGKSKRRRNGYLQSSTDEQSGVVWHVPKAHTGSITKIRAVPGTSLFLTGSKDGDVKLWDVNKCELVNHWHRVHEKRLFLQHSTHGLGPLVQAAVMDLRILTNGFITCGTDGFVKHFRLENELLQQHRSD